MNLILKAENKVISTILISVLLTCLFIKCHSFSIKMNMDTQSADNTISTYFEDVG